MPFGLSRCIMRAGSAGWADQSGYRGAVSRLARRLRYALWHASARLGRGCSLDTPQRLTVLITCCHPARVVHVDTLVRHVLRCHFVDAVVVSSHNPAVRAEDTVRVRDQRLMFLNATERRGCGLRWPVAAALDPEYLLVIDDDMLLRASQVAGLFQHLVALPAVPHGLSGMRRDEGGALAFVDRRDVGVEYLCEVYAVTRRHLRRYAELRTDLGNVARVGNAIDSAFDFLVISSAGSGPPRIHDLGHILRCETFKAPGVAVHREDGFAASMAHVTDALGRYQQG